MGPSRWKYFLLLLQVFASAAGWLLILLSSLQVLNDSTYHASLPLDAVYLCGLELRGASWDAQQGALENTDSLQPCSLPFVCVKAQVMSTNIDRDTFPCKRSHLKDASNVQVAHASPSIASQLPLYHCPLYLNGERESGNWGLADVNIITMLPLHAKLNPVLCSLRRVRLVSMLWPAVIHQTGAQMLLPNKQL